MSKIRAAFNQIANFALFTVLIAAWFASAYPAFASYVTATMLILSCFTAAISAVMVRKDSIESEREKLSCANRVEHKDQLFSNVNDASASTEVNPIGRSNWIKLLDEWKDEGHLSNHKEVLFKQMVQRALSSVDQSTGSKSINIGVVNLIVSAESASIKMGNREKRSDTRTEKIDIVLRPDLSLGNNQLHM